MSVAAMDVRAARPAGEAEAALGVAGDAVGAVGRDVAGNDAVPCAPVGALAGVGAVVAGVAAAARSPPCGSSCRW